MNFVRPWGWKREDWPFYLSIFALLVCLFSIRLLTFDEPFDRDLMVYATAAHEILGGRPLYSDIWDIKPPGIYGAYAASQFIFGYGRASIFALGLFTATLTLGGIFRVVADVTGNRSAALWASFFWVVVGSDLGLQANQPNSEAFINAALVWGMVGFVASYGSQGAFARARQMLWFAGFGFAVASLFKQVAVTMPLFLGFYVLAKSPLGNDFRARMGAALALWTPLLGVWAATFAFFAFTGRAGIFYYTVVEYGRTYARHGAQRSADMVWFARWFPDALWVMAPLLGLIWLSVGLGRARLSWFWGVLGMSALAIQAAIVLPGHFFAHYFQLWLPWFCIGAGVALEQWRIQHARSAPWAAGLVALGLLSFQVPNWRLSLWEVSLKKYGTPFFVDLPARAQRVDALLLPGETFYQYGFDPGFYFETRRPLSSGVLCLGTPLVPLPPGFQARIIADLERTRPEMAVVDSGFPPSPVTLYLERHYQKLPQGAKTGRFVLMGRRGGALMHRLGASSQRASSQ